MSRASVVLCQVCGDPIDVNRRGRRPKTCSPKCRTAAWRFRCTHGYETAGPVEASEVLPADPVEAVAFGRSGPSDEQAALAIMEARNLIGALSRLSHEARPEFAWRFAELRTRFVSDLTELFGDVVD